MRTAGVVVGVVLHLALFAGVAVLAYVVGRGRGRGPVPPTPEPLPDYARQP